MTEHTCFDLRHHYFEYDVQHLEALVMNAEFDRDYYKNRCSVLCTYAELGEARRARDFAEHALVRSEREYKEEKQAHQFTRGELAERTRERDAFKIRANDKDTECIDLMRDLDAARAECDITLIAHLRNELIRTEKERDALRANLEGKATERCLFIEGYDCSPENVHELMMNARAEYTRGHEQGWDDAKAEDRRLLQAVAADIKSAMDEFLTPGQL